MRLRTQFILTVLLFGTILVVMATSAIVTSQQIGKAAQQERRATHIGEGAAELAYLSNDYLIYGESQQLKRWRSRFDAFSAEVAGLHADRPEQQALVINIQANKNRIKEVFDSAASTRGNPSGKLDLTSLHLSWGRMAVQSQGLVSDATRLSRLLRQQMEQLTKTRTTLIYVMVGLFGLFLMAGYMLTYRRILKSVERLRTGAAVIGSGNLDFMIEEEGKDDEIGDLSRAFNKMTVDLKTVTASKTDLEREIVEREKAQVALRESEQRWATTLSSIGDAVIATNTAGRITFMNNVAELLTGWTLSEASMKPIAEVFNIVNEDSRLEVESPIAKVLREGMIVGLANHTILVRKDGAELPIDDSGAPIRDKDGNTMGVVLVFRDITERRRAEEALQESENKFRSLFESMAEGVALHEIVRDDTGTAIDYRILGVNPAFEQKTGIPPERANGALASGLYEVGTPPYLREYEEVVNSGTPLFFETYFSPMKKHFSISAIRTKPDHFAAVFLDITERKRMEEALRTSRDELELRVHERTEEVQRAYERLKEETTEREKAESQLRQTQKMEALGTLSGGIAHDFNNILAAIIGFTELVEDHLPKGSREARHVRRVLEAGMRGRDLVRQMLAFSRKADQQKKPLRVSSVIEETVALIRATIPTTIDIRLDGVDDSKLILADPTQIQQVLINLCTNASHAMREKGGTLGIQLDDHVASSSNGNPPVMKPGLYAKLTVHDTGTGISPDIMEKIFDPFFTTKALGEGTGLGLSVVHGIVKQHDGYITVASEPGKGTSFTVYFPQIANEPEMHTIDDEGIPGGSERILFVDDEEALAEMGEDILAELGYQVTSRVSSREALELFKLDPSGFDLIVTDQTMPNLTGTDLAKEILALKADIPIIMCTGFSDLVDADSARAAGIRAFVMKPLTKKEIAKTVRKVLDGPGL